jgi:hypothetical protein
MAGDSSPTTFTLHDAAHSYRVAQLIVRIAEPERLEDFKSYDLGLLLLAAYLHDIGMTPGVSRLSALMSYLLSGDATSLPTDEENAFQAWLDDHGAGASIPLAEGPPTNSIVQLARSLIAHYVRFRHNDWSGQWIQDNLEPLDGSTYQGFVADLKRLCMSHHDGLERLRSSDFDPRLVGAPASALQLRFDACLLRLADVLDFDPERTPAILFLHRDVEADSAIFWHKDHALSFVVDPPRITLHARPNDALTHHAVELSIADVDRELALCRQLADELPFEHMEGTDPLPYRWQLDTRVHASVKPRDNAYEYIDGTFRPDQDRILELLGGVALYGSPLAAVRELLQNAFDAVSEQIAYQRLREDDPASPEAGDALARLHKVSLTLDEAGDGIRLRCRDTGVGMSRDHISSRFLVSGSGSHHDLKALERACVANGFDLGRTGKFGIGVLAYFLLAERVTIRTKRSLDAPDSGDVGWRFTTHGLADFGELRQDSETAVGTEVDILIKPSAVPDGPRKFAQNLDRYIRSIVRHAPCRFSFTARGSDFKPINGGPGWIDDGLRATNAFLGPMVEARRRLENENVEILSSRRRNQFSTAQQRWEEVTEDARSIIQLVTASGDLKDGLGHYRVWAASYPLLGSTSLVYMDVEEKSGDIGISPIQAMLGVQLGRGATFSWHGMSVRAESPRDHRALNGIAPRQGLYLEIDWTSDRAGELAVNRNSISLTREAEEALELVRQRALGLQADLVRGDESSPFSLMNAQVARVALEKPNAAWPQRLATDGRAHGTLAKIPWPNVDFDRYLQSAPGPLLWRGDEVAQIRPLESHVPGISGDISWHGSLYSPQAVAAEAYLGGRRPIPIWTKLELSLNDGSLSGRKLEFPKAWSSLIGARVRADYSTPVTLVWNRDHPLVQSIDSAGWEWSARTFESSNDPVPHEGDLLQTPARAAAWIMGCALAEIEDLWEGLPERAPNLVSRAWQLTGLGEEPIVFWDEAQAAQPQLRVISLDGWQEFHDIYAVEQLAELLPEPEENWCLRS